MRPIAPLLATAAAAVVVALAGCGVEGGSATPAPAPSTTIADAPADAPSTTVTTATTAETEPEPEPPGPSAPSDGETFEGDGYTIEIGPTWSPSDAPLARGIEAWAVGPAAGAFQPNVNVLVQDRTAQVDTLEAYLRISERQIEAIDGEVLESATTTGASGQRIARMRYDANQRGADLSFLSVTVEVDGGFALATFTSPADRFDELVDEAEPYLLTLRATA